MLISKYADLITITLSNIFTVRLIGNKTHGDLAEIAIAEFINQYMYDLRSIHVGKDLYRAKSKEEDIRIVNEITKAYFPLRPFISWRRKNNRARARNGWLAEGSG